MRAIEYSSNICFHFFQPSSILPSGYHTLERLSRHIGINFDVINTILPENGPCNKKLKYLCNMPRMSTLANGAIINKFVSEMPPDQTYVNVGVWHGFSFLAGMICNDKKKCIGIDNFSEFGGPKTDFLRRFNSLKRDNHTFYDMDFQSFFKGYINDPVGVYFYDGAHDYDSQLKGLEAAEPFLADSAIVLVDDTNWNDPYNATMDFVKERDDIFEIIFNVKTSSSGHPTFWNGLLIVKKR